MKLVGTQIQPHHNWLKSTACQLNQPHCLDAPPSRPWQLEFIFALMRVYFPGQTVELEHRLSAKYMGKVVEPVYCSFSLSKAHKSLTKESELPLRSCPALLGMGS